MEEDIKILEEIINRPIDDTEGTKVMKQAIENLIAKNEELEEENIKYEKANDYLSTLNHKYYEDNVTLLRKNGKVDILADDIHFKYIDMVENYIPKSKVKEKIEYLKKELQKYKDKYKNDIDEDYFFDTNAIERAIAELEDLLQERS